MFVSEPVFFSSCVHLPQGLLRAVHPPSHLLLPGITAQMSVWNSQCWGGRLQVHCTLQEGLTNQGAQTQGLTNHTTGREGGGIKPAQSGIRSVLSAGKCFEMSLATRLLHFMQQISSYAKNMWARRSDMIYMATNICSLLKYHYNNSIVIINSFIFI